MADEGLALSDLVQAAADELRKIKQKPTADAVMQFTGCEIELAVKASVEGGGGLKFWIVELSGKAAKERSGTIKLAFGAYPGQSITAFSGVTGAEPTPKRKK